MRGPCLLARPLGPGAGRALRLLAAPRRPGPRRHHLHHHHHHHGGGQRRGLLTLAIESSCDDTCVAVLEKDGPRAALRFNARVTSDNRAFRGVHPTVAVVSHTAHLAGLVQEALRALPEPEPGEGGGEGGGGPAAAPLLSVLDGDGTARLRRRPDFVAVTRGPGMTANLSAGLNTAKGLAVAWQVPLVGVNHMQAHALTPRMVSALAAGRAAAAEAAAAPPAPAPAFPFLSLLVSGGHTLLVLSRSLCDHAILAEAHNIAIGDMLDKCARAILPPEAVAGAPASSSSSASSSSPGQAGGGGAVVYGRLLESFVFPAGAADYRYAAPARRADELAVFDSGRGWQLQPPLRESAAMRYDFSGLNGAAQKIALSSPPPSSPGGAMSTEERRLLGRETMRLAFEHLGSRVVMALKQLRGGGRASPETRRRQQQQQQQQEEEEEEGEGPLGGDEVRTLVVSGGVASNRFLMHVLRGMLDARGFGDVALVAPPAEYCTDNAAMIAWAGAEMYEAGWRTDLSVLALRKWPLDPRSEGGGIPGADGWVPAKA